MVVRESCCVCVFSFSFFIFYFLGGGGWGRGSGKVETHRVKIPPTKLDSADHYARVIL